MKKLVKNNQTGLRLGSVVKEKRTTVPNHLATVIGINGTTLTLESINQRERFNWSAELAHEKFLVAMGSKSEVGYVTDRPDFQFSRNYTEVELVTY